MQRSFGVERSEKETTALEKNITKLDNLTRVSTEMPTQMINSIMVAEGEVEDSWCRKAHFSLAENAFFILGYYGFITDIKLQRRIKDFKKDFVNVQFTRRPTKPNDIRKAVRLVKAVLKHVKSKR